MQGVSKKRLSNSYTVLVLLVNDWKYYLPDHVITHRESSESINHIILKESESESESEFHLFEPHSVCTLTQYLNMIIGYEVWIRRPLLRPVWSLSQGPPNYNINYY